MILEHEDDDDEELLDLKERLARYNLNSSPENSTGKRSSFSFYESNQLVENKSNDLLIFSSYGD